MALLRHRDIANCRHRHSATGLLGPRRCALVPLRPARTQRPAVPPGRTSGATGRSLVSESLSNLARLQRQMEVAVSEENYTLAAQLRDQTKTIFDALPATQQYMYHQLRTLHGSSSVEDKLRAVAGLGATGDEAALPHLAELLSNESLQSAAQGAMWSIFMTCKDPTAQDMLSEGTRLLPYEQYQEQARQLFDKVVSRCPSFAEGYNKRATLNYMQRRFAESIKDCQMTLELQPYHFGAASGMGLCHLEMGDKEAALRAFELALDINPGLTDIARMATSLRQVLTVRRTTAAE